VVSGEVLAHNSGHHRLAKPLERNAYLHLVKPERTLGIPKISPAAFGRPDYTTESIAASNGHILRSLAIRHTARADLPFARVQPGKPSQAGLD